MVEPTAAMVGLILLAVQGPLWAASTPQVWAYDAAGDAWAVHSRGPAVPDTGAAVTWIGTPDPAQLAVCTRSAAGRVSVWTRGESGPERLVELPAGATAARCVLVNDGCLWVGTDAGLYRRSKGEWSHFEKVIIRRERVITIFAGYIQVPVTVGRVTAIFPLDYPRGGVSFLCAAQWEGKREDALLTVGPNPTEEPASQLVVSLDPGTTSTRDSEGTGYLLGSVLRVWRVDSDSARLSPAILPLYDPRRDMRWNPPAGYREASPSLFFFDREEVVWAGMRLPAGNEIYYQSATDWVIDPTANRLLADQGALYYARDPDDVAYIGTGRGRLLAFDGRTWTTPACLSAIAACFPDGKVPPLRPACTADNTLWVVAGNLLFALDCPAR